MLKFLTNDQFPEEVKDVREILMARLRGPLVMQLTKKVALQKGRVVCCTTTLKIFNNIVILV